MYVRTSPTPFTSISYVVVPPKQRRRASVDHKSMAQRVLKDVGGAGNIVAAALRNRLRLVLKNQDKVTRQQSTTAKGSQRTFLNAGQFQVIIGDVNGTNASSRRWRTRNI